MSYPRAPSYPWHAAAPDSDRPLRVCLTECQPEAPQRAARDCHRTAPKAADDDSKLQRDGVEKKNRLGPWHRPTGALRGGVGAVHSIYNRWLVLNVNFRIPTPLPPTPSGPSLQCPPLSPLSDDYSDSLIIVKLSILLCQFKTCIHPYSSKLSPRPNYNLKTLFPQLFTNHARRGQAVVSACRRRRPCRRRRRRLKAVVRCGWE